MKTLKLVLSLFLVALAVLSVLGIRWWTHPPEALAASTTGGQFILALGLLGCCIGLWRLWRPGKVE